MGGCLGGAQVLGILLLIYYVIQVADSLINERVYLRGGLWFLNIDRTERWHFRHATPTKFFFAFSSQIMILLFLLAGEIFLACYTPHSVSQPRRTTSGNEIIVPILALLMILSLVISWLLFILRDLTCAHASHFNRELSLSEFPPELAEALRLRDSEQVRSVLSTLRDRPDYEELASKVAALLREG